MNILQVRSALSDAGPGTQPLTIATELRRRGHSVSFATSGGAYVEQVQKNNFPVTIIPTLAYNKRGPLSTWSNIRALAKVIKEQKIDVIHGHNAAATLVACIGGKLAGCKFSAVSSVRGLDPRALYQWRNYIYHMVPGRILAVSEFTLRELMKFGIAAARVTVTYNGFDQQRFNPITADSERIRREFSLGSRTLIGCVGTMVETKPTKGQHVLVEALAKIRPRFPDAHVVFVGDGPGRAHVEQVARDLNMTDHVTFAGMRFDTPDFFSAFDIYCLPSIKGEMFPNSIVEAMAMGKPWVGSDIAGLSELTAEGRAGTVVPIGDADSLANALIKLLEDRGLRLAMGVKARKEAVERFTISAVVDRIESAYRKS